MKSLVRLGRLRRMAARTGPAEDLGQVFSVRAGRVIAAGGEALSTSAATTNDRNGAQGATSEVGRSATIESERKRLDVRRSQSTRCSLSRSTEADFRRHN